MRSTGENECLLIESETSADYWDTTGSSGRIWRRAQEEREIRAEIRRDRAAGTVELSPARLGGDEVAIQAEVERRRRDRARTAWTQREAQEVEQARRDRKVDEQIIADAIRHEGWYNP